MRRRVDRYRWLETRHQVNIQGRWNRDKTDDLQFAFFNGEGWESWENVWGIWNGITPRDGEATRRMATIERGVAPFLVSSEWEPFYPMHMYGIFASRWPLGDRTVWTIVNRNDYDVRRPADDRALQARHALLRSLSRCRTHAGAGRQTTPCCHFPVEATAMGMVLATPDEPDAAMRQLMSPMKAMTAKPLSSYSHEWKMLPQQLVEIASTEACYRPHRRAW